MKRQTNFRARHEVGNQPYRFGVRLTNNVLKVATLKHDLKTGARTVFDHGPGMAAGEPVLLRKKTWLRTRLLITFLPICNDQPFVIIMRRTLIVLVP